jgi:hypothetical protein
MRGGLTGLQAGQQDPVSVQLDPILNAQGVARGGGLIGRSRNLKAHHRILLCGNVGG